MFTCEHRFERLKYRIRKNFVNRAKIKILFRLTTFFDEKDKFFNFKFNSADNNVKPQRSAENTTLNKYMTIKLKKMTINICNPEGGKQIIKKLSHGSLFIIKIRPLNRQSIHGNHQTINLLVVIDRLINNCNSVSKREKDISERLQIYSMPNNLLEKLGYRKFLVKLCTILRIVLNNLVNILLFYMRKCTGLRNQCNTSRNNILLLPLQTAFRPAAKRLTKCPFNKTGNVVIVITVIIFPTAEVKDIFNTILSIFRMRNGILVFLNCSSRYNKGALIIDQSKKHEERGKTGSQVPIGKVIGNANRGEGDTVVYKNKRRKQEDPGSQQRLQFVSSSKGSLILTDSSNFEPEISNTVTLATTSLGNIDPCSSAAESRASPCSPVPSPPRDNPGQDLVSICNGGNGNQLIDSESEASDTMTMSSVTVVRSHQPIQATSLNSISDTGKEGGGKPKQRLRNSNRTVLALTTSSSSATKNNLNFVTGGKSDSSTDMTRASNGDNQREEDRIVSAAAKNSSNATPNNPKSGAGKNSDENTAATTIRTLTAVGSNQGQALTVYIDKIVDDICKQMQSHMDQQNQHARTTAVTLGQLGEKIDRSDARAEATLKETVNSLAALIQEALRDATLDRSQARKANGGDHHG